jgi:LmbE family N-acetylglucosaminyl deacetylase
VHRVFRHSEATFSDVAEIFHAACGLGTDTVVVRRSEDIDALVDLGGHVDHRITRTATLSAAGSQRTVLWEDVPYAFDLPPRRTTGNPLPPPSGEHLRAKLDAVGHYRSQVRMLWPGQDWEHVLLEQAADRIRGALGGRR